jgi:hypothetical protein
MGQPVLYRPRCRCVPSSADLWRPRGTAAGVLEQIETLCCPCGQVFVLCASRAPTGSVRPPGTPGGTTPFRQAGPPGRPIPGAFRPHGRRIPSTADLRPVALRRWTRWSCCAKSREWVRSTPGSPPGVGLFSNKGAPRRGAPKRASHCSRFAVGAAASLGDLGGGPSNPVWAPGSTSTPGRPSRCRSAPSIIFCRAATSRPRSPVRPACAEVGAQKAINTIFKFTQAVKGGRRVEVGRKRA